MTAWNRLGVALILLSLAGCAARDVSSTNPPAEQKLPGAPAERSAVP